MGDEAGDGTWGRRPEGDGDKDRTDWTQSSHSLTHSLSSHASVSGRSRISMALLCVTMVVPKYDKISQG